MLNSIIQTLLNTSEAWALLIPLTYLLLIKVDAEAIKEIIIYLWIALILNLIIVIISFLPDYFSSEKLPFLLLNNSIEYNIHSTIRVVLFSMFFIRTGKDALRPLKKTILAFFLVFVILNFSLFESPVLLLSSRLFTAEAVILLFFCVYYYLSSIVAEKEGRLSKQPIFWFTIGLSIYEAVNFFIFLLFTYLATNYTYFAQRIWNYHNISFIILCLFITKALHESRRK